MDNTFLPTGGLRLTNIRYAQSLLKASCCFVPMSADKIEADMMMCCAFCGITSEVDDIKKLKNCTACYLVKYCSIKCQKEHRPQHKRECKKRAAELRDDLLFKQPESSHLGDCPICMLPLPLDLKESAMKGCCSKMICIGCEYGNLKREFDDGLDASCPFCRHPAPESRTEAITSEKERAELGDPVALRQVGTLCILDSDHKGAFGNFMKAAELGDAHAHYQLSLLYHDGHGVEKEEKKRLYHLEKAVIGGHPDARYSLGCKEWKDRQHDRAIKHFIIAAKLGSDDSLAALKQLYEKEIISKEDFATALRAHQGAVDATKSPQREASEEFLRGAGHFGVYKY